MGTNIKLTGILASLKFKIRDRGLSAIAVLGLIFCLKHSFLNIPQSKKSNIISIRLILLGKNQFNRAYYLNKKDCHKIVTWYRLCIFMHL
jgi:hypothetical protein